MNLNYLPNLTAQSVETCEPWTAEVNRPQFASKEAYRLWCNDPTTEHAFISAVNGRQPTLRVSNLNPATHLSGLVLDYDAIPSGPPELLILTNAPSDLKPAYVSRTFSGNCRVLYIFEAQIPLFSDDIAKSFLKRVASELKLRKLLPGFEIEALLDLGKYYEIGENWQPVGDGTSQIPTTLLMAWLNEACNKHKWAKDGPGIPMEALREEGRQQFGDYAWLNGWDTFDVGARGRRFWDESATDPTAVIVRESGCQYFSEGGGFQAWAQIFGTDFVRKWHDNRIGAAIDGIWFDGKSYWKQQPDNTWRSWNDTNIRLHFNVAHKLSKIANLPGSSSEIDQALHAIQKLHLVNAAMPFIYKAGGVIDYNGAQYLNISNVNAVAPFPDPIEEFGDRFPLIAEFLFTLFDPDDQLDYFLSWLKHFYVGAVTHEPHRGLALFIAGPVGAGKTMLSKAIIGRLMGGRQDAGMHLLQGDKFNDSLFKVATWTIDDEVIANDPKQRASFTQMVKKIVANDSFTYRAMFRSGDDMEWLGRIIVTMNDDPESLQILPETDRNILDKILLLKVKVPEIEAWPTDLEIESELPFFGGFLRDWDMPQKCKGGERFGVAPFQHPTLLEAASSTSETATFEDLLLMWRKEWFAPGGPCEDEMQWTGNATELLSAMCRNHSLLPIINKTSSTARSVGIHLNKLLKQVPSCPFLRSPAPRNYSIFRP